MFAPTPPSLTAGLLLLTPFTVFMFLSAKRNNQMGGALIYHFPNEPNAEAIVPYYKYSDHTLLSQPKKHVGSERIPEKQLTQEDIDFLNQCSDKAFDELTQSGHVVKRS